MSEVSISQSRGFSFQVEFSQGWEYNYFCVSISQSRCFSFQVSKWETDPNAGPKMFQSRNRDAFHFRATRRSVLMSLSLSSFNLAIEMLFISGWRRTERFTTFYSRFNLAIEMLFISGWIWRGCGLPLMCFNLAIEMLFISGGEPQ